MKSVFSRVSIALLAAGLAGVVSVSAAIPAVPTGKLLSDTAATASSSDIIAARFSERVCNAWRRQGRAGNKYSRQLYMNNCRGRNEAERRRHWRRQCDEWHRHSKRGQRYHAFYRDNCRDYRPRRR